MGVHEMNEWTEITKIVDFLKTRFIKLNRIQILQPQTLKYELAFGKIFIRKFILWEDKDIGNVMNLYRNIQKEHESDTQAYQSTWEDFYPGIDISILRC